MSFPVSHQVDVLGDQRAKSAVSANNKDLVRVDLEPVFIFSGRLKLQKRMNSLLEEEVLGLLGQKISADDSVVSEQEQALVDQEHI